MLLGQLCVAKLLINQAPGIHIHVHGILHITQLCAIISTQLCAFLWLLYA